MVDDSHVPLGPALRRAWIAYQRRIDADMAAAGFDDRKFPDGRVLRMCRDTPDMTISRIGRELGITRQGAAKIVAALRERRYVKVAVSPTSGREKVVTVTPRALEYLAAHRKAARAIETRLCSQFGAETLASVHRLLDALGGEEEMGMRDYLRNMTAREN